MEEVTHIAHHWLTVPPARAAVQAAAEPLARPHAAPDIARRVLAAILEPVAR